MNRRGLLRAMLGVPVAAAATKLAPKPVSTFTPDASAGGYSDIIDEAEKSDVIAGWILVSAEDNTWSRIDLP